ncbi:hypothetical protein CHUAL_012056 [Chamberlinius hualienensis]
MKMPGKQLSFLFFFWINSVFVNGQWLWSDEFDGEAGQSPSIANRWTYDIGDGSEKGIPGWGNGELQYYTDSKDNCVIDGHGHLIITAKKINDTSLNCHYGSCSYTSCRLLSNYTQKYGRFEARMKLPNGKGIWPAFWMLGNDIDDVSWPKCGEIDIMEFRGSQTYRINGAIHGPGFSGANSLASAYVTSDLNGHFHLDYHVFAVNWEPDKIEWLVDDVIYSTLTPKDIPSGGEWVFNKPFKMLINLAIGGHFDGYPVEEEVFPKLLLIDYVRVYKYNGSDGVSNAAFHTNGKLHENYSFELTAFLLLFASYAIYLL